MPELPPLAGFFSKDEILWMAYIQPAWKLGILADRIVTAVHHGLLHVSAVVMTFFGDYRGTTVATRMAIAITGMVTAVPHESPW